MRSRPTARRRPRPWARPLCVEPLEGRWLPSTLTYTAPSDNHFDDMVLRLNGNKVELLDNNVVKASQGVNGLTAIQITGASGEDDQLTVDYGFGGLFSVPN